MRAVLPHTALRHRSTVRHASTSSAPFHSAGLTAPTVTPSTPGAPGWNGRRPRPPTRCRCARPCRRAHGSDDSHQTWHCGTARVGELERDPGLRPACLMDLADLSALISAPPAGGVKASGGRPTVPALTRENSRLQRLRIGTQATRGRHDRVSGTHMVTTTAWARVRGCHRVHRANLRSPAPATVRSTDPKQEVVAAQQGGVDAGEVAGHRPLGAQERRPGNRRAACGCRKLGPGL